VSTEATPHRGHASSPPCRQDGRRLDCPRGGADRQSLRGGMGGPTLTGDDVRSVFEPLRPQDAMGHLGQQGEVRGRQRPWALELWVRAMALPAGTPGGASQADVSPSSRGFAGPQVTRAAFSRGCDAPVERCRAALAERALAEAQVRHGALPGPLRGLKAWSTADAPTVRDRDARLEACRGAGPGAALKGPTGLAGGCGAPGRDHRRPARGQDGPHPSSAAATFEE
jgi:hypothetical protein